MAERDFQELLNIITKTIEQIGRLETKIAGLEKQIASGDLGAEKVRQLNAQITALLNNLQGKQIKLGGLLSERDLRAAEGGLDRLSRSVATVKKNLDALYAQRSQAIAVPGIEDQIRRQERALALLQAQQNKRGLGTGQNTPYGGGFRPTTLEPVDERRLNAVTLGIPLTNAEILARGRATAQEVQNQLLRGAIEQRKLGPSTNLRDAVNRATNPDIAVNERQNEILRAAIRDKEAIIARKERIRQLNLEFGFADETGGGPVTVIPGGSGARTRREVPLSDIPERAMNIRFHEFFEALSTYAKRIKTMEGLAGQGGGGRRQSGTGTYDDFTERVLRQRELEAFRIGRLPTFNIEQERERARRTGGLPDTTSSTDRARETQQRLINSMKARIAAEDKYRQALEQAQRLGFNVGDLKRVQTRGTAGIEQLQFERMDESGVNRRFDTYVQPSGRATPGISNQFRSFGQGVVRDIGELTKWSLALAAVYGPLRKLQELTQIMIENQTRLAEAATSVASSFIGQAEIFDAAASAANRAGESVEGVIDAFTLAYRAAGGGGSEVERFATATELLDNALILSKLSTLDQATAIDTLAAAMRQTTGELSGSIELLDSWVRVTKVANVDLASLATGFAVLGDSAEAAGLSTDQLNGVLATIGETGVASGRELANTARAIVAGFQSDQAREALENIGVAVEDSTGKMRPFLDIMTELSNLRVSGVLDDTAFSKLTLALGGGTRRQAAYATFIENIGRVNEIAAESSRANGDAQAALARQLETVQTSLTRLGNAFQELAQSLGTEGGFLGIITSIVDGMTGLVNIFDSLISLLGKATPALLAFVAASAALKYRGQGGISTYLGNLGAGLQRDEVAARYYTNPALAPAQGRGRQFLQNNVLGTNQFSGGVQGLLTAAIPAILNFTNQDDRYGKVKGGADIVGGVAGGIIGSLAGPGAAIVGASIGVAIAEAFVNSTIARSTDIFAYGQAPKLAGTGRGTGTTEELDEALREAETKLYESIGFGSEAIGKFLSTPARTTEVMLERLNQTIRDGNAEAFERVLGQVGGELLGEGITPTLARGAFAEGKEIELSPENKAYRMASEEARRNFDAALAARTARGGTPLDSETAFSKLVEANKTAFGPLLDTLKESTQEQLRQQRVAGEVRGAEYGRRTTATQGFDVRALNYYTALGNQVDLITGGSEDASKAFEVLNNVIIGGAEEALPQLTSLTGEIQTLLNILADPAAHEEDILNLGGIDAAQEKLSVLQETLGVIISDINQQVLVGQIKVPDVQGDVTKPLTIQELGVVEQRAKQLQDNFYQGFLQIPDDMYTALKDSWDEWAQIVEDSGNVFFEKVSDIDPQFFQQAMQQLLEENKLKSQAASPFGIQQVDLPGSRAGELQSMIDYFSSYLSQNFPQYEQKPEEIGVIFNDYVTSVLHGDNLAMKLALEKLVDIGQKQLDGMYNIPEGATFWVPLTAAYYRPKNEGGGGLPGVSSNEQALKENTQALKELALGFRGDRGYGRQAVEDRKLALGFRGDPGYSRQTAEDRRAALGFRGDLGYGRPAATQEAPQSFLQTLQAWLRNIFTPNNNPTFGIPRNQGNAGAGRSAYEGVGGQMSAQQINPQVNARLEMRIENSTQLLVDGRVLASIITPYLASDLLRLDSTQGTITKRFVI